MELHLSPDQQARLADLAQRTGQDPDQLVNEAVARFLEYEEWFGEQVSIGLDQIRRGQFIEHDEVMARLEKLRKGA